VQKTFKHDYGLICSQETTEHVINPEIHLGSRLMANTPPVPAEASDFSLVQILTQFGLSDVASSVASVLGGALFVFVVLIVKNDIDVSALFKRKNADSEDAEAKLLEALTEIKETLREISRYQDSEHRLIINEYQFCINDLTAKLERAIKTVYTHQLLNNSDGFDYMKGALLETKTGLVKELTEMRSTLVGMIEDSTEKTASDMLRRKDVMYIEERIRVFQNTLDSIQRDMNGVKDEMSDMTEKLRHLRKD
jgi:hypothetical protein